MRRQRSRQQHFLPKDAAQWKAFACGNLVCRINNDITTRGMHPLCAEQIECLCDGKRATEATAMIDDLEARCGLHMLIAAEARRFIDTCRATDYPVTN